MELDRAAEHFLRAVHIAAGPAVTVECSCSWTSPKRETEAEARVDFDRHAAKVARS